MYSIEYVLSLNKIRMKQVKNEIILDENLEQGGDYNNGEESENEKIVVKTNKINIKNK